MENNLWAKKSRADNIPMWLPLKIHLKDTMEVCGRLWDLWLSEGVKYFLVQSLDDENKDFDIARNLCRFLGGIHDIGKATPIFQVKKSFYNDVDLDDIMLNKLKFVGFQNLDDYIAKNIKNIPHQKSGQYILSKYVVNFCVANIVGAHHGKPIPEHEADECFSYKSSLYQDEFEDSDIYKNWDNMQKNILDWALEECEFSSVHDLPKISQPGQAVLSGLLVMADWISSNEKYFPLINIEENSDSNDRIENGFEKWQKDRAKSWDPQNYEFENVYDSRFGFDPRDAQAKITEQIENIHDPGIIIFEAPMGMGKTEAALVAVEQLAKKTDRNGMFFALPTQATSNGIFHRVKEWLEKLDGENKSIRLVHGKAALNDEFASLPKSKNIYGDDSIVSVNEWFSGRKTSILDDFVVGTVDQILLMALKQKHLMLRHLGFSNKVVVIDEVHAYDAYMSVYLYQAIKWLGAYNVPVVILSATLPVRKRNQLLEAYMIGKGYKFRQLEKPSGFEENEAYPLLTFNDDDKIIQFDDFEKDNGKDYEIIKLSKEESADIKPLIEKLTPDGGVVGVVLNTVKKAQEFARKCVEHFGENNVDLLHSSFIATDRYNKEKQLLDTIGKKGDRPKFKIIIGTQVIEQSLDIDFDVMITDLAPMDLILQRMGRLHRHKENNRPENLKEPKLYVLKCKDYDFDTGSTYVYDPYLLFMTEYYLPDAINLPNDISHLVQLVYSDEEILIENNSAMLYNEYKTNSNKKTLEKENKAKVYRIDKPLITKISEEKNLSSWIRYDNKEANQSEIKATAQVRDSVDTIEVIALKKCEGGYEFFDKLGLLDPSDNKTAMEIAKRTIKLPNPVFYIKDENNKTRYDVDKVIEFFEDYYIENLSDWDNQSWLKNSLGIIFDENGRFKLIDKTIKYDTKFGIIVEKEESLE